MNFSAQIEFNLTISDTLSIYSKNYNNMLLQQCRSLYENKCMDQQYIVSIDKLIKRSLPNLIRRDLDAKVRVFVVVEATIIRFDKFDTITNMVVNKIIPKGKIGPYDLLECSNNICRALLQLDEKLIGYNIGDIIPIKVGTALLKIQNPEVLINAYPFAPNKINKIVYLIPKFSTLEKDQIINNLIPIIETKLQLLENNSDTTSINYFEQLLYPFKSSFKKFIGKQIDLIQFINNLDKYEDEYVYIDQTINLSELKISILTRAQIDEHNKKNESNEIISSDNSMFISILIFTFAKHIDLIYELSTIYADKNVFTQHKYLWDLYENNKFTTE